MKINYPTLLALATGQELGWILTVRDGLQESYARHPWLAYGTDWLAFAHFVIALFFIGSFIDPARNVWVLQAGIMALSHACWSFLWR